MKNYLNNLFGNQWISVSSQTHEWLSRSSDLTPFDFLLWGYVKEKVYVIEPTIRRNMKKRTREAFSRITLIILQNVPDSFAFMHSRKWIEFIHSTKWMRFRTSCVNTRTYSKLPLEHPQSSLVGSSSILP